MSTASSIATIHRLPGLKPKSFQALILAAAFSVDPAAWRPEQLTEWGLEPDQVNLVETAVRALDLKVVESLLERQRIRLIVITDPAYPAQLREIPSPPPVLYVRGDAKILERLSLAVVGTRRPTAYGLAAATTLVEPVARAGISIVSGLALGIDSAAHRAALAADGPTVAVLGCGLNQIYPWQNHPLAEDIISHGGAVISEFPLGAEPERHHFPQRNRIISGLAKAVLLVEAGEKSGALITAKFAVDQNRDVFVVPGNITSPQSVGPLNWLKLGATPVTSAQDVLNVLSAGTTASVVPSPITSDDPTEAAVIEFLRAGPRHVDVLAERCRLDSSVVSAVLSLLEIRGLVAHDGGMIYRLNA